MRNETSVTTSDVWCLNSDILGVVLLFSMTNKVTRSHRVDPTGSPGVEFLDGCSLHKPVQIQRLRGLKPSPHHITAEGSNDRSAADQ